MKALIFDMDNTLVFTERLHEEAMVRTFKLYGANVSLSHYRNLSGAKQIERMDSIANDIGLVVNAVKLSDARRRYEDILDYSPELKACQKEFDHLKRFGLEKIICWDLQSGMARKEMLQALDDQRKMIYLDILRRTHLGPMLGVREFMESIPSDIPAAVASSSSQIEILQTLKKVGLYTKDKKHFSVLASGYEVEHGKPSPDVFLLAAERLQVKPEECIVFEDSMNGLIAAKNAGMQRIAIQAPGANEDLSSATLVLESFQKADIEFLKKL